MTIVLDRMEIEEAGANPVRLADGIHDQLGAFAGPVPVKEIARALDIAEVRIEPLANLEGALITTPERNTGAILLNGRSSPRRQRFTLGQELGHFLNPWHQPTAPDGFHCSREDMLASDGRSNDRYLRQEAEANLFSIELLTPRKRLAAFLRGEPDLGCVLAIADEFDISREASTRRYVSLHEEMTAALFSRDGQMLYAKWADRFPRLAMRRGDTLPELPELPRLAGHLSLSPIEHVDADDWLAGPNDTQLTIQTLHQQDGRATTLLRVTSDDTDYEDPLEDSFDRFTRFG